MQKNKVMKEDIKKIYIARSEATYEDEYEERSVARHPEHEHIYGKLTAYYDVPVNDGRCSRKLFELPNYMYPEIKCGTYKEFASVETIEERVDAWDTAVEFVENRLRKSLMEAIDSGKLVIKEKNVSPEYFIKNLIGNNFIKKEERQQFFGTYPI